MRIPVVQLEAWERQVFLQKVFSFGFLGMVCFALSLLFLSGWSFLDAWELSNRPFMGALVVLAGSYLVTRLAGLPVLGPLGGILLAAFEGRFLHDLLPPTVPEAAGSLALFGLAPILGLLLYLFLESGDWSMLRAFGGMFGFSVLGLLGLGFYSGFTYMLLWASLAALLLSLLVLVKTGEILRDFLPGQSLAASLVLFCDLPWLLLRLLLKPFLRI